MKISCDRCRVDFEIPEADSISIFVCRKCAEGLLESITAEAKPVKRWWLSWYSAGSFELTYPWWISGHFTRWDEHEGRNVARKMPIFVAAVEARSEAEAKALIGRCHDSVPERIEWRFCDERAADWEPFTERFERALWMIWPLRTGTSEKKTEK